MDRPPLRPVRRQNSPGVPGGAWTALAGLLLALVGTNAGAQQADRERAQMLQLQQQLQRVQSDNASLQRERSDLASKAQETDKLKKESEKTGKALIQVRLQAAAQGKELSDLRAQLADATAKLTAARSENEALRKAVADRNDALAAAAADKRHGEQAQALLAARLKVQTGRGDLCEQRHEGVMKFSSELIDRYENERLRLCEPVTGIWKVREQAKVQSLREQLYAYRLDIPAPAPPKSAVVEPAPAATQVPSAAHAAAAPTPAQGTDNAADPTPAPDAAQAKKAPTPAAPGAPANAMAAPTAVPPAPAPGTFPPPVEPASPGH